MDLVLGYFILSIVPCNDGRSLGSRFTPDSLKQLKTGLKNLLSFLLKRPDSIDDPSYTFFNGVYTAKRNKYATVPQENVQGDRKRVRITQDDMALRDVFLTQDVDSLKKPGDLCLIVGTALLEADIGRGTCVLRQIRRSYISLTNDETGNPMVNVKGNAVRKTMTGSSKEFKAMKFSIRGECEVSAIKKLLDTLPAVGCRFCIHSEPPKKVGLDSDCVCEHIFLQPRDLLNWRSTDKTWFVRSQWSEERLKNLTKNVSMEAGTSRVYTNGCIRPTNCTGLALTGLTPDQIAHSFNLQKNLNQQEKYKREGEMMTAEEKRIATMVNTASGRTALRGLGNKFGPLTLQVNDERKIYEKFNKVIKGGQNKEMEEAQNEVESDVMENVPQLDEKQRKQKKRSGEDISGTGRKVPKKSSAYEDKELGEDNNENVPLKVFAKIRGFPFWPAEVMEMGEGGTGKVRFQDGQIGVDAILADFTQENLKKFLGENFKKKKKLKLLFLKESGIWGLGVID